MKIREDENYYFLKCQGCDQEHLIPKIGKEGANWKFNMDFDNPSFSPSVKITWIEKRGSHEEKHNCCHFNIISGKIHYCGDCTHEFSNKVLSLTGYE
jgi:hypothetical protein